MYNIRIYTFKGCDYLRVFLTFLLFLTFFMSSYGLALGGSAIFNHSVYALLLIMIVMLLLYKKISLRYNKFLVLLTVFYAFTLTLSSLFNSDLELILNAFTFLIMCFSTMVVICSYFKDSIGRFVVITLLLSHSPLILIPMINGIDTFPYKGIFDNPNAFGLVATTIFAVFLATLLKNLEKTLFYKAKPSKVKVLAYFLLTVLSFLLVVISASRTSFLACLISLAIGLFFIILISIKHKLILSLFFKTLLGIPLLGGLYFVINIFIPVRIYIEDIILNKFTRKSDDILSGRGYVWKQTMADARAFGFGEGYFEDSFGIGAHNTFIYILGVYGWLATIIFLMLILVAFYYCTKLTFSDNKYNYLPIIMLTTFIVLSMGENMFHKSTMLATFILVGFSANNRVVVIRREHTAVKTHKTIERV